MHGIERHDYWFYLYLTTLWIYAHSWASRVDTNFPLHKYKHNVMTLKSDYGFITLELIQNSTPNLMLNIITTFDTIFWPRVRNWLYEMEFCIYLAMSLLQIPV